MAQEELTDELNDALLSQEIYGVSFSLTAPKQNQFNYWGFQGANLEHIPLTPQMYYDLASLTKVVATTTRILQLLVSGQLKLTDTVSKFLPAAKASGLTIEQLLLHRTGLPADLSNVHDLTTEQLTEQVLASEPQLSPGTVTKYSDLNFIILGWIIQIIDGDLAQSVQEHIFAPLKMKHTFYQPENIVPHNLCVPTEFQKDRGLVQGTVHDYKAHLLDGVSGHAGLFSTLQDLTKFTQILSGLTPVETVLPSKIFALLKEYDLGGRTLGWQRWSHEEQYWHTGFTGTSIAFDREQQTGFVCLTNRIYPTRENTGFIETRRKLLTAFFGREREWNE